MKIKMKILITVILSITMMFTLSACLIFEKTSENQTTDNTPTENDTLVYKTAGTYKVGIDIIADEYLLVSTKSLGYLEVTLTSGANIGTSNFLYNDNFVNRKYVKLNKGEYIKFSNAKLYKLADAAKIKIEHDGGIAANQLKVGVDINPGEYIIVDNTISLNYLELTTEPNASVLGSNFLFNDSFEYRHFVLLEEGQYLSFTKGKIYSLDNAPAISKLNDGSYRPGQYKTGFDFKSGTLLLRVIKNTSTYYEITNKPLSKPGSSSFLKNGNTEQNINFTIIGDDSYIYFTKGSIVIPVIESVQ